MPIEVIYVIILFGVIAIVFIPLKRPIYEAMLAGYLVLLIVSGQLNTFFTHIISTSTNTLFFTIVCFLTVAQLFSATKVIEPVINTILATFGRFRGGAGWVSLIGSTFMATLTGSGAGNVAATGVFTIPSMKKSGLPAHLAANIEASTSTLGNSIPPSGIIVLSFGALNALYPDMYTMSSFWIILWGIGLWFLLQRALTIYGFCRYFKVQAMAKDEMPDLKENLKKGWPALLLPLVIFFPFIIDLNMRPFLAERIGTGVGAFTGSVLMLAPGIAAFYSVLIARKSNVDVSPIAVATVFGKQMKSIIPVTATIFWAYCISSLFTSLGVGPVLGELIAGLGLSYVALAFILPLFTAIIGMIIPGSAQVAIFGSAVIAVGVSAGMHPLLVAAMLPSITGAMEGVTPPMALCTYTAMGIAGSGMKETTINSLVWIFLHYAVSVSLFLGLLPILGFIY